MSHLLRDLFTINRPIIFFIYGQVFFVLGLAIALQSWRHSRLSLARSPKWLAAFGFTHGLHEWGDLFIPFGIETLRPLPRYQRLLRYLPGAMLTLWIFWTFGPSLTYSGRMAEWYTINNSWARYCLGFPGALLAAYGLRRQARELIAPLQTPHILRTLRVAGLALAGYGMMGGLAVPPGDFFPANWSVTHPIQ
ncbi:MAG: hypothetical protein HYR94_25715 [Chloroflexi bacterium]|nr:hypothetical protein [Chloroflexota bacterium]